MLLRIDERFQEIDRMPVDALPVPRDAARHLTQKVRRQMGDVDPRQNEVARIVGEEADITAPSFCRPAQ